MTRSGIEHEQLQQQLRGLERYLEDLNDNTDVKIQQIQKLSELMYPMEKDMTFIIRDTDRLSSPRSPSLSSPTPSKSSTSKFHKSMTKGENNLHAIQSMNQAKLVKDGETYELERKVEEAARKVSALCDNLIVSLVIADDYSRSIVKETKNDIDRVKNEAAKALNRIEKLENESFMSASEYLRLRLQILILQREEAEESHRLYESRKYFERKEKEVKLQLQKEINNIKQNIQSELFQIKNSFQRQYDTIDEKMKILKKKDKKLDKLSNGEIVAKLRKGIEEKKEMYERLRRRNALELEGYQNEINLLRQRFKHVQVKEHQHYLFSQRPTRQKINQLDAIRNLERVDLIEQIEKSREKIK